MNATILRAGVLLSCVFALPVAAESEIRVAASRELRLAVVDANKSSPARAAMYQAFADTLSASLAEQCGGDVGVRAKRVGVHQAANNFNAGVYDAVLVLGRDVPSSLRRVDAITLSATPTGGSRDRTLYLLIAEGDPSLQGLLATGFTRALNDQNFLRQLAAAEGDLGETVASR